MKQQLGITVKKEEDMPEWYNQVVLKSKLASYSSIKGCMVIRPNGYALWEKVRDALDCAIKKKGVSNAYFPLFIPESFFNKEAEHAEGFKPEVAWIENKDDAQERLAVRPTSETIMYNSYSDWIRSWRDLPLKINQWCNIVRWEVSDVKLFVRSREFLWQEGHCVYATEEGCKQETFEYLEEYSKILEELLAVPVITGYKTEREKFAGAVFTTTIESLMPDGKALQCATSHNLGNGFAKAFDISFIDKDEKRKYPYQNSWGLSTRVIGALVMMHADNKGLVLPPRIAPTKASIIPILFEDSKDKVIAFAKEVEEKLDICTELDLREDCSPGFKFADSELRGIPIRIEVGPRDVENDSAVVVRRDTGEKKTVSSSDLKKEVDDLLETMHKDMFDKAKQFLDKSIVRTNDYDKLTKAIENKKMVYADFCGEEECEDQIKADTGGATTRVIPFGSEPQEKCIKCHKPAKCKVYFARNY